MNVQRSLHLNTRTEVTLSKALNQLLPGHRGINDCPLLRVCHSVCVHYCVCVCVHFGWVKCRAQIPSMGHHTWPYVTSLHLFFFSHKKYYCSFIKLQLNHWCHMDCFNDAHTIFLGLECFSCIAWIRKFLDFIKNILICVPKMEEGLMGLDWHEGE